MINLSGELKGHFFSKAIENVLMKGAQESLRCFKVADLCGKELPRTCCHGTKIFDTKKMLKSQTRQRPESST